MFYVDSELCTGCGACLPTCNRGALTLSGDKAVIDENRCTSCGLCREACPTGAIICMEVTLDLSPLPAPARYPEAQSPWAGASYPPIATMPDSTPTVKQPAPAAKWDLIERVLGGLFSIATCVLDRREAGSNRFRVVTTQDKATAVSRGRGSGCRGQGKSGKRRRRVGGGVGPEGSKSPGAYRQGKRRNRTT